MDPAAPLTFLLSVSGLAAPVQLIAARTEASAAETAMNAGGVAASGPVVSRWSNPELVLASFNLWTVLEASRRIAREVFGEIVPITPGIELDPESGTHCLTFDLTIEAGLRDRRYDFEARYVRETVIPEDAPAPVLLWSYRDAAHP